MYQSRRARFRLTLKQKFLLYGLVVLIGLIIAGFILSFIIFAVYAKKLPSPGKLAEVSGFSTVFYDRDGKVLYESYKEKNRVPVKSADIADNLKKATVSIEDKNFYRHKGISEAGIVRAFINILLGKGLQSGSTITQQLIKNVLLGSEQSLPRKIKEIMLAGEVERRYNKDEILEMYLNEAPYGGSYWGVGSAARGYFGKEPKNLNLVESAIIAGLPQSPTAYSPYIGKSQAWKGRATDVLRRMREDGYITTDQEKKAAADLQHVTFTSTAPQNIQAPHFVFYVKDQIEKQYGAKILDEGLKVKTTLSLDVQNTVEKIVKEEIGKLKNYKVGNGAVVVLDSKTGEILAMVGSKDYFGKSEPDGCTPGKNCVFDPAPNAALSHRQPGSSVKPITYAVAFEKGYTPATLVMDVKTSFGTQGDKEYTPVNYDGKFRGPTQLRFALGNSLNIPAVKVLSMIGIHDFMQKAYDMGLKSFEPTDENIKRVGLSVTLGGGESTLLDVTSAFSVFARGGTQKDVSSISEITDFKGNTVFKANNTKEKQVLSPEVSFLVSHILSDNNARVDTFGTNSYLVVPGKTVAVKTGTTDDKRDNWAIGFTKSITVGSWVGNNDNSVMNEKIASGVTGASPIWSRVMRELLKKYDDNIIEKPSNVEAVSIDSFLGGLPKDGYPSRAEYFIKGTEPKDTSPFYKKVKISKATGKLANDVEIKLGQYDEKDFVIITENDPISADGKNRWQEGIDNWMKEQKDDKYHAPTEVSDTSSDSVVVSIKDPGDHAQLSNSFSIKAKVTSIAPIKSVKIIVNGNEVRNLDGDREDIDENISLSDGAYEIAVVARNDKDKAGQSSIKIGVNKPWDSNPTPTNKP